MIIKDMASSWVTSLHDIIAEKIIILLVADNPKFDYKIFVNIKLNIIL